MASIPLKNSAGADLGTLDLPDAIFGVDYNESLVHQAIVTEEANYRQGTHSTKTRAQVRGGGRKPWKQKGTGRARQGTIRAPQWRKGGVVGGPTPRDYRKAFPVKMRRGAMRCVLSGKVAEGAVIGLDALAFDKPKTKDALAILKALGLGDTKRVLIIIPEHDETLVKSVNNLQNVEIRFAPNFSVRDTLVAHKIVLIQGAVAKIEAVWTPKQSDDEAGAAPLQQTEEVAA